MTAPVRDRRRTIGFVPGLLYALAITGIAVWGVIGFIRTTDPEHVAAQLHRPVVMALLLFVGLPALLVWGGLIGSARGSQWAFLLTMLPASVHAVVGLLMAPSAFSVPSLLVVLVPAELLSVAAVVTAPWQSPRRGVTR